MIKKLIWLGKQVLRGNPVYDEGTIFGRHFTIRIVSDDFKAAEKKLSRLIDADKYDEAKAFLHSLGLWMNEPEFIRLSTFITFMDNDYGMN